MRIAICDDDERERNTVEEYVRAYQGIYPSILFDISAYCSGEELLAAYQGGAKFDFLFLDIQMKDIDGIQTAQKIRKTNKHAIIFFITGFTQYISDAFTVNAFQFLLKPVKKDAFDREFQRALDQYFIEHKTYMFEDKSRTIRMSSQSSLILSMTTDFPQVEKIWKISLRILLRGKEWSF